MVPGFTNLLLSKSSVDTVFIENPTDHQPLTQCQNSLHQSPSNLKYVSVDDEL